MTLLHRTPIPAILLIVLAAWAQPAHSGSTSIAPVAPAPPAVPVPGGAVRPPVVATEPPPATSGPYDQRATASVYGLLNQLNNPPSRGGPGVLVIPARELDAETFGRIVEDLSIMSRIIEKNLASVPELVMYSDLYGTRHVMPLLTGPENSAASVLGSSSERPKSMYIGGYGVLFSLTAKFPLVPPAEAVEPNQAVDEMDRTWAQARQELLDPQAARRRAAPPEKPYNAEAVEALRSTLIGSLKHATNIRDLQPDDWLTILVQGPAPTDQVGSENASLAAGLVLPGSHAGGRTFLTLRVKKADIDQYAKGQLDETQFPQRVQITTN